MEPSYSSGSFFTWCQHQAAGTVGAGREGKGSSRNRPQRRCPSSPAPPAPMVGGQQARGGKAAASSTPRSPGLSNQRVTAGAGAQAPPLRRPKGHLVKRANYQGAGSNHGRGGGQQTQSLGPKPRPVQSPGRPRGGGASGNELPGGSTQRLSPSSAHRAAARAEPTWVAYGRTPSFSHR